MNIGEPTDFSLSVDDTLRQSDDLYRGISKVGNPNQVETLFQRYSLTGSFRLSDEFVVSVTLPFLDAKRKELGSTVASMTGLGDVSLITTWRPSQVEGLSLDFGFYLPTGNERAQPLVGDFAPSVFQLGTGSWQAILGAGYHRAVGDWTLGAQVDMILPLETSSQEFRPAEAYFLSFSARREILDNLGLRLALQGKHNSKDEFLGTGIPNSGSDLISLRPSVIWQIHEKLNLTAAVDLPLYQKVNQTAIAVGPTWQLSLSTSF